MSFKRLELFVCLLSLTGLLLSTAGCAPSSVSQQQGKPLQLTAAEEEALGERTYRQIVQQMGGVYPDSELNDYVNRVGQLLAAASQQPGYQFQILNDSVPNVFSLPGGYVAVTRGLLVKLQSEAQLAAVLGSEIGHLIARHYLQELRLEEISTQPVDLIENLSDDSEYTSLVEGLPRVGAELISKQYSLDQEIEADRTAIDLMVAAGYQPTAIIEMQTLFLEQMPRADVNERLNRMFLSHPFSAERLEKNREYIGSSYPQVDGHSGGDDFELQVGPLRLLTEGYGLYDQGRDLERQGNVASAIETYHQALQVAPDEALIMAGLGLAYLRIEDSVPARRYLLKAVKLQGDYAQSRLGLGYVYLQKWQYALAIKQLDKSLQLLPTVEAAFLLAEAQQQIGQKIKARDLYLIVASADREGKLGQLAGTRLKNMEGE